MRQVQGISVALAGMVLTAQPSLAAATQVTGVQLNEQGNELKLVLETQAGAAKPQVQTVKNGNELIADLANSKLNLQSGTSFRQENPLPGIKALVVSQLDDNKVRVTVSGEKTAPNGQILQENAQGISLGISTEEKAATEPNLTATDANFLSKALVEKTPSLSTLKAATATADKAAAKPVAPTTLAQVPQPAPQQRQIPGIQGQVPPATQQAPATITTPVPTVVPPPAIPAPSPDVMVPNPKITIDGIPAPATGAAQPVVGAPPFLPRAVAPPVGDIAISNINASASYIDLGTGVRVPRLVLREAPVREVLSLLARSAGLNIAYIGEGGAAGGQPGAAPGGAAGAQKTISLDLENEPVQNVFNYVLQVSGLQANRVGNTILVGSQLPDNARNLVSRTLRLNQVTALEAANFLISQGAEQQQLVTQTTITVVGEGPAAQRIQNTSTTVQRLAPQEPTTTGAQPGGQGAAIQLGALVLRGLLVSSDARLNAITLVGEPRKIEVATALLNQLDLRRRQVAVNVKIVDINLLGTDAFNASFSFGIGNGFFAIDNGTAVFNYGGIRPPTAAQAGIGGSVVSPPVITNPFSSATVFLDPNNPIPLQGAAPGTITLDPNANPPVSTTGRGTATFPGAFINLTDPLRPGITTFTQPTDNIITVTPGTGGAPPTVSVTQGTPATVTQGLPSVFQFPKRLLAALQAQVTSGNAKILTDPTIVVQEGQTATVNLTQEVFGGIRIATQTDPTTNLTTQSREPIIKNAGLILQINVQRIDDNGFITLTANPIVSAIGGSTNTADGTITLVQQRQLQSGQIRLRDGQTLILSGIIQESDRTTVSKVPILGDIPILGALFRSTSRDKGRNEVIVLLTPQILDDSQGSSFGYNYTPGRDARQMLRQSGAPTGNN